MVDKLTPKKAFALGASCLLLIVLVGWFLFLSPKLSEAAELEDKIGVAEANLLVAQALTRDTSVRETEAELARLKKAVPEKLQMSGILRELAAAATSASVRITGITPVAATPMGGYHALPITVAIDGRYSPITKFLQLLRKRAGVVDGSDIRAEGRLYSVESIQFGAADDGVISATMTMNAFYFGGAPAAPDATATTTDPAATATAAPAP
jgi:Tfp pilus assembly protein PilO